MLACLLAELRLPWVPDPGLACLLVELRLLLAPAAWMSGSESGVGSGVAVGEGSVSHAVNAVAIKTKKNGVYVGGTWVAVGSGIDVDVGVGIAVGALTSGAGVAVGSGVAVGEGSG